MWKFPCDRNALAEVNVSCAPEVNVSERQVKFYLLRRLLGVKTEGDGKAGKVAKLKKGEILMVAWPRLRRAHADVHGSPLLKTASSLLLAKRKCMISHCLRAGWNKTRRNHACRATSLLPGEHWIHGSWWPSAPGGGVEGSTGFSDANG